jgi:hypothetical protein
MEMSLFRLLETVCATHQSPITDHYLRLAEKWTLGPLVRNLADVCQLPAGLTPDAVGLRNRVIHKDAYDPTEEEATKWLELASATAELVSPRVRSLPTLEP